MSAWAVAGNLQEKFNNIRQASAIPKRRVNHEACEEEIWVDLSLFWFFFSLHQCFLWWLSCDASSHFRFWSASLDACYCEWHLCSTSENLSRRMQPERSVCNPPQNSPLDPFCKSKAWFMEAIGCKNPLNRNTSYFVCCQDMVETSSSEPEDSVSRSAGLQASNFREVLSQKREKTPPKLKPLRD